MNGGHDLGGMHGLGAIAPESSEPVFHEHWERRVFALTLAAGFLGKWNIDIARHARERQHPADYIANSYYENWLAGLLTLLKEHQLLTQRELDDGVSTTGPVKELRPLPADRVVETLTKGGPVHMQVQHAPTFAVGDHVRVKNAHPSGHTRVPRYIRGHAGTVCTHYGAHVYPDQSAQGIKEGQHVYSIRFTARELWGNGVCAKDAVYVDVWDNHLEPV